MYTLFFNYSFKKLGKVFLPFLLILPTMFSYTVQAQIVNVTIVAKPPLSSNFNDYADLSNKVIITLINTSPRPVDIMLHGKLALNSDRYIATNESYKPAVPIHLEPNIPKVFVTDPQQLSFLKKQVVFNTLIPAQWQEVQQTGFLPEGNWQLCIYPIDFTSGVPYGEGCAFMSLNRANAPVLISPFNKQIIPSQQPNIIFSWTPPIGNTIGAQVVYDLYAVKLLPGQNPNDAINAAVTYNANNPFIKKNLTGNQYVTQPFDLKLDTGATYVAQVVARDLNKQVAFQNNGRSEVNVFTYGKKPVITLITTTITNPDNKNIFPVTNHDPVPISTVKGKLFYKFKEPSKSSASNKQQTGQTVQITGLAGQGDGLTYNKEFLSASDAQPLSNIKVSLVLTYVLTGKINGKDYTGQPITNNSLSNPESHFKDYDLVLATATTSSDGSFSFQFMNTYKDLGLTDANFSISHNGEIGDKASGKLYKVFRLRVENKYYCSPDVNIKIAPWKGVDLGSLVSYVKSYNLNIKTKWTDASFYDVAGGHGTPLAKIKTTLLRKKIIQYVPPDEAGAATGVLSFSTGKTLSQQESDGDGIVSFTNLVQHDPDNLQDRYYIRCDRNEKSGDYIFKPKEKSYYPLHDNDKNNFPFNSTGEYTSSAGGFNIPGTYGKDITWNSELVIKTYYDSISLYPDHPRIAGKVQPAAPSDAKPLVDINVVMLNAYAYTSSSNKLLRVAKTDNNGRYHFEDLDIELDSSSYNLGNVTSVKGPDRTLITKPEGYNAGTKKLTPLKYGQQITDADFFLYPDGYLTGYVEDEDGNAVQADIQVDEGAKANTKMTFIYSGNGGKNGVVMPSGVRQIFNLYAPSGKNRKLAIDPTDAGYENLDTVIQIQKAGPTSSPLLKFIVYKAKKRIRFQVVEKPSGNGNANARFYLPGSLKPVSGAKVKLDLPGSSLQQTTGSDGYVTFVFENQATDFTFNITPPDNLDLEEGNYTLSGVQNVTTVKTYSPAYLKKAARISGTVTLGAAKTALDSANIFVELGGGKKIETQTDNNGKYVLKGVPLDASRQTVWATKPGAIPNIIGQSQIITLKAQNELDFNLHTDDEVLIENLFGFHVEIKSKTKQTDGTWLISGNLINLPGNDNFKLQDDQQTIPFADLKIKKSGAEKNGIPIGIPVDNAFNTDLPSLKLIVQNSFGVVQSPASGDILKITSENGKGKITGKTGVQKTSFQFSQSYLNFNEESGTVLFLTEKPGSSNTTISTIAAGTQTKQKFGVVDNKGNNLQFKLLGFTAKADKTKSFLEDKNLSLYTTLSTNDIPGMNPGKLEIDAGVLMIHPDKFDPLNNNNPIKFKLENWEVTGNSWQLQQTSDGIAIPTGTIKTGVIDVPIKNMVIKPNSLDITGFDINNLTFSGVVPVHVLTQHPSFGYNTSVGTDQKAHWELRLVGESGQPGVSITNLPGMKAGATMNFQTFSLLSNGEQSINTGNQQQVVTFYDVLKVTPMSFTGGDKYFNMQCGIDLDIPQYKASSGIIKFSKPASMVLFELYPLNVSVGGPGGVDFLANVQYNDHPQKVTDGNFSAMGTIKDKEGIVLKAVLHRNLTNAWIEVDPKNQTLPLGNGQTSLADIEGKMDANMQTMQWNKFTFSGRMNGFKGVQGDTRKTFIVNGSITADNEKIDVKNFPSAFGGIGLTYDIENARFIGNLQLDKSMGPLQIKGTANLLVDGSGWYFLAGGQLQTPGIGGMSAGLLIGDYNHIPADASQQLMQYAYDKTVPPSFKNGISGFFFTGEKDLPVINIPDYSISLGVLNASFGVKTGLDARMWMDFSQNGNEYGIGAMAFAHAYFSATSITCTKLSADARAELGIKGVYSTSTGAFTLNGCGSFTIGGSASQCFPTPCLSDGICCEACIGGGVSQSIKVNLLLDSKGNTDLSFGFGNCSGQNTMTGNW